MAMYSGLITHSDDSEEEKVDKRLSSKREDDVVSVGDREVGNELEDDPDFMASDDPPDEYQSV